MTLNYDTKQKANVRCDSAIFFNVDHALERAQANLKKKWQQNAWFLVLFQVKSS